MYKELPVNNLVNAFKADSAKGQAKYPGKSFITTGACFEISKVHAKQIESNFKEVAKFNIDLCKKGCDALKDTSQRALDKITEMYKKGDDPSKINAVFKLMQKDQGSATEYHSKLMDSLNFSALISNLKAASFDAALLSKLSKDLDNEAKKAASIKFQSYEAIVKASADKAEKIHTLSTGKAQALKSLELFRQALVHFGAHALNYGPTNRKTVLDKNSFVAIENYKNKKIKISENLVSGIKGYFNKRKKDVEELQNIKKEAELQLAKMVENAKIMDATPGKPVKDDYSKSLKESAKRLDTISRVHEEVMEDYISLERVIKTLK